MNAMFVFSSVSALLYRVVRGRALAHLPCVLAAVVALIGMVAPVSAQPEIQLRWEFVGDVAAASSPRGVSVAALTLMNRGSTGLEPSGWAIYFNSNASPAAVLTPGVKLDLVQGDLYRLAPADDFKGLGPGQSLRVEYRAKSRITNVGTAPTGPYLVLSNDPDRGTPLEYSISPWKPAAGTGTSATAVTPEGQYALNEPTRDLPLEDLSPVLPTPLQLQRAAGRLQLSARPRVEAPEGLAAEAALVKAYLDAALTSGAANENTTPVRLDLGRVPGQDSPEAYELVVDPATGVRILGNSGAGVFYGLQSLRSLLPSRPAAKLSLPALRIVDAPRFAYRGLLLDVARNFQTKEAVLAVLELMARYKLNTLHLHLTDDEGWRLEIPSLPELTTAGARRGHSAEAHRMLQPAYGSGPDANNRFGSGHYSRSDYLEIIRRAHALKINVIPEIEMPGHARAAIEAMEARFVALQQAGDTAGALRFRLREAEDRSVYASVQDYRDNVMNPGLESTYAFISTVVGDIVKMHRDAGVPLTSLHVGGDEVPAGVWEKSPAAEALRLKQSLPSVRELWSTFYTRVESILVSQGIAPSGWEEVGVKGGGAGGTGKYVATPEFAGRDWRLYAWNNIPGGGAEDLPYLLANGGYKVVLTIATHLYFDLAYNNSPEERGLSWAGYNDIEKPFQLIPLDYYRSTREDRFGKRLDAAVFEGKQRLTEQGRRNILGIQANLWSETLGADGRLEYMLLPKLFGLAERAWAPEPTWAQDPDEASRAKQYSQAWSSLASIVGKRELPRLLAERPQLAYRIPTPGLRVTKEGTVLANLQLPGFVLRFTTDGTEPTASSTPVRGPIRSTGTVTVAAFDSSGRKGLVARVVR